MEEDASGLQSFAGWLVSLSMFAGYVLPLKLLAPGVLDWIDTTPSETAKFGSLRS